MYKTEFDRVSKIKTFNTFKNSIFDYNFILKHAFQDRSSLVA